VTLLPTPSGARILPHRLTVARRVALTPIELRSIDCRARQRGTKPTTQESPWSQVTH